MTRKSLVKTVVRTCENMSFVKEHCQASEVAKEYRDANLVWSLGENVHLDDEMFNGHEYHVEIENGEKCDVWIMETMHNSDGMAIGYNPVHLIRCIGRSTVDIICDLCYWLADLRYNSK